MQGLQPWFEEDADEDIIVLDVHVQTSSGAATTPDDAAAWAEQQGLTFPVLADPDRWWDDHWGAFGRATQRSYVAIGSDYRIAWRLGDGSVPSSDVLIDAVEGAD